MPTAERLLLPKGTTISEASFVPLLQRWDASGEYLFATSERPQQRFTLNVLFCGFGEVLVPDILKSVVETDALKAVIEADRPSIRASQRREFHLRELLESLDAFFSLEHGGP